MNEQQMKAWLQKNTRYLASFDLNKDKQIQADELAWAMKTLDLWRSKTRADDARWRINLGSKSLGGFTWGQVGVRCATKPMTFVGLEGDTNWLPFVAVLRAERPDLPDSFEEAIPVALVTTELPEDAQARPKGVVTIDRLCTSSVIAEVVGAYSAPRASVQDLYLMELAVTTRLAEQELRVACRDAGGTAVCGVRRELVPVGKFLHLTLSGTLFG